MSKNQIKNFNLINGVSTAATITSDAVDIEFLDNVGLNIDWTGTTNGTITVECSNLSTPSSFKALTFDPVLAQPAGVAGGYLVDINNASWSFIRVVFTRTSGTGTLTVSLAAKGV